MTTKDLKLTAEQARLVAHEVGIAKHYALFAESMKALKGTTIEERTDMVLKDETLFAEAQQHRADYIAMQEAKRAQEVDLKNAAKFAKAIMPLVAKTKMSLPEVEKKWGVAVRAAIEARQSI